jgi:hypothetical protein
MVQFPSLLYSIADQLYSPPSLLLNGLLAVLPWSKQPPPSTGKNINMWSYTSTPSYIFTLRFLTTKMDNFTSHYASAQINYAYKYRLSVTTLSSANKMLSLKISTTSKNVTMLGGSLSPQHGMYSGCRWRIGLQLWSVAANILNK